MSNVKESVGVDNPPVDEDGDLKRSVLVEWTDRTEPKFTFKNITRASQVKRVLNKGIIRAQTCWMRGVPIS